MYRNDGYDVWVVTKEVMVKVQVSERRRLNEPSVVWVRTREGKGDEGEVYEHHDSWHAQDAIPSQRTQRTILPAVCALIVQRLREDAHRDSAERLAWMRRRNETSSPCLESMRTATQTKVRHAPMESPHRALQPHTCKPANRHSGRECTLAAMLFETLVFFNTTEVGLCGPTLLRQSSPQHRPHERQGQPRRQSSIGYCARSRCS